MTKAARGWQEYAVYSIRDVRTQKDVTAIQVARDGKEPLTLSLEARIPAERILDRDADNMIKLVQDSVTMALWPSDPDYEDCFVFDVHVCKRPTDAGEAAFVLVALSTLEDQELRHAIRSATRKTLSKSSGAIKTPKRQPRTRDKRV